MAVENTISITEVFNLLAPLFWGGLFILLFVVIVDTLMSAAGSLFNWFSGR